MSQTIKIGTRVSLLDENIKGTISSINGNEIHIIDSDGFERICQRNELIIYDSALDSISNTKLPKRVINKPKKVTSNPSIIDLHSSNSYSNQNEILKNQLAVFTSHINRAISSRKQKVIFIHGEGEGILRKRLEQILSKNSIVYGDAPYHEFGYGAIEVYLSGINKLLK